MAKLLLLVIGLFVAYWFLKGYKKKVEDRGDHSAGEDMVRCAQCGLHLPKSESVPSESAFYCCAEHRRAHDQIRR